MRNTVIYGDALTVLKAVPANTVQTVVTSPPYWGLRDFGTRSWFDGDPTCDHDRALEQSGRRPGQLEQTKWKEAEGARKGEIATTATCSKCGAWLGQLGLEPAPEDYVRHMVEVFREVRRVLRDDGTLWLNMGDSYNARTSAPSRASPRTDVDVGRWQDESRVGQPGGTNHGELKPKDLVGMPWRLALALQDDGWYLRSEIIWEKPTCLPESVQDRPTRSHEHVFLLAKSERYFYDADAVKEPVTGGAQPRGMRRPTAKNAVAGVRANTSFYDATPNLVQRRNLRSVWSICSRAYRGAHFATFPPELPERCIRAGSRPGDLVLDPFAGSGTTLMVARDLGRDYLGIELNPHYRPLIEERVHRAEVVAGQDEPFRAMLGLVGDGVITSRGW
jgi:site-specific DNA-methyltransferase (adenine-specific)